MVTIQDLKNKGLTVIEYDVLSTIYNEFCRNLANCGHDFSRFSMPSLDSFTTDGQYKTFLPINYVGKHVMLVTVEFTKCLVVSSLFHDTEKDFRQCVYAALLETDLETIKNNYNDNWSESSRENIELMINEGGGWTRMSMLLCDYDSKLGFVRHGVESCDDYTDFEIAQIFKYDLSEMNYLIDYEIKFEENKPFVIE